MSPAVALLRTVRPHQWVKNLFVLAVLVFSKHLFDADLAARALIATACFCALSGAVYAFNDLRDLESDRLHPTKRHRPIAAGALSERTALIASVVLASGGLIAALVVTWKLAAIAAAYLVVNLAYTLRLKQVAFVDVALIAAGFLLRVLAGAVAIDVAASPWLLACTGLLATFLGFGKRAHELAWAERNGGEVAGTRAALAGYRAPILRAAMVILAIATCGGYVLYTQDPHTVAFFGTRDLLWSAPFPAIGIGRFLWLALVRPREESPTEAMLRDWAFLLNIGAWAVVVLMILRWVLGACAEETPCEILSGWSRNPQTPIGILNPSDAGRSGAQGWHRSAACYNPAVPDETPSIARRKADHIEVAASGRADFAARTTLLDEVELVHQSLPELAMDDIDLSTTMAGLRLRVPLVITGMTGGTQDAGTINRDLARAAARVGAAFGVGSQRAMAEHPELEPTFQVKASAPDVVLIGNIGVVQAGQLGLARVAELARRIGADAMAVHLNPAQEMIQDRGDRDFRGAIDTIAALIDALPVPVIVKETGCGLSPQAAARLRAIGVTTVDVAGAGGTSWTAVETERAAPDSDAQALGRELWDWGLPTAVSTAACAAAGLEVIASGGLRTGLDVVRALALGARAGGMAAPILRAQRAGGEDAAVQLLERLLAVIRAGLLLTGCRRPADLASAPRHLGPSLRGWLADLGIRAP
jgi:isopentenyl-diphosphate delta-isomerase